MTTSSTSVQDLTQQALTYHQQGNFELAEKSYRQALAMDANNSDLLQLYGALKLQQGDLGQSENLLSQAITTDPNCLQARINLGIVYTNKGELEKAVDAYTDILTIDPQSDIAWINIGNIRHQQNDIVNATAAYEQALTLNAPSQEALLGLAALQLEQGKSSQSSELLDRCEAINSDNPSIYLLRAKHQIADAQPLPAITSYFHAISLAPTLFDAHFGAANLLYQLKHLKDAKRIYQHALKLQPGAISATNNLANTLISLGEQTGAIELLKTLLEQNPNYAEGWNNLGMALQKNDQKDAAIEPFKKAIELEPHYVEALSNLGQALVYAHRPLEALKPLKRALEVDSSFIPATYNMGYAFNQAGMTQESYTTLRDLLKARPDLSNAHDTLLMYLAYDETLSPEQQFEEHKRWGDMHGKTRRHLIKPHGNDTNPNRTLRIGYVSSDLANHPVGRMGIATLEKHDPNAIELYYYSGRAQEDDTSKRFRQTAKAWRKTHNLSDQQIADQIRADKIDILIDLSGHTADTKLTVFAQKPAPIQMSWLGYCDTTGLDTVDYILMDEITVPESMDSLFTEHVIRLPTGRFAYSPPPEAPEVAPAPALMNGYVTFGSFNNLLKLTPDVIAHWSKILKAVPNSKLVINWMTLREIERCQSLAAEFLAHGITRDRLDFLFLSGNRSQVLGEYQKIDIALDSFPYSGGITTSEALWMGVPVITLLGDRAVSRQSAAIINAAGFPQWVAETKEEFVQKAIDLANNVGSLYAERKLQRQKIQSSRLLNSTQLARDLENSYRQAWANWCNKSQ